VTETESWVDQIRKTGFVALPVKKVAPTTVCRCQQNPCSVANSPMNWAGGQFGQFKGQALAVIYLYALSAAEYCPRLSRNFQEASQKWPP